MIVVSNSVSFWRLQHHHHHHHLSRVEKDRIRNQGKESNRTNKLTNYRQHTRHARLLTARGRVILYAMSWFESYYHLSRKYSCIFSSWKTRSILNWLGNMWWQYGFHNKWWYTYTNIQIYRGDTHTISSALQTNWFFSSMCRRIEVHHQRKQRKQKKKKI